MRAEVVDMSADVFSYAEEFIAYIRSTYMNGAFGNEDDGWEWNAFERVEDVFLTNNPSEGAINRLRKRARTDHPGFYRFCDLMKEESISWDWPDLRPRKQKVHMKPLSSKATARQEKERRVPGKQTSTLKACNARR